MFLYVVQCTFEDPDVAAEWLDWLRVEHVQDVVDAGAIEGRIWRLDGPTLTYQIHYQFPSREAFQIYESEHAPRLREEGLRRFPLELGLKYERVTAEAS